MRIPALLLLGLLAFVPVREAAACSCVPPPPPAEELARRDAVFAGTATRIRHFQDDNIAMVRVRLRVERAFKGTPGRTVEVVTPRDSATCGFPFTEGQRYLVYANAEEGGGLGTSLCSRTARLEDATEDLTAFDALDLLDGPIDEPGGGGRCGNPLAMLQGMVFIFLVLAFRRQRPSPSAR